MPNPLDLERVKAYCAKATAGPWYHRQADGIMHGRQLDCYRTVRGLSGGFLDGFCEWEECVYCKYEKDWYD